MKKMFHVSLAATVVALVVFTSCSKGSKGDTGATGATGAQGPAGPDSVYHSPWAQLNATMTVPQAGDTIYHEDFSASVVTQSILDSGIVMGYVGFSNGTTITDVFSASDYGISTDAFVGGVEADASYDFSTSTNNPMEFRFVVIPGSVLITNSAFQGLTKETIRKMSYADLNKVLGNTLSVKAN